MNLLLESVYEILEPMLPKKFDENEVFTLLITIFVLMFFFYLQKKKTVLLKTEVIALLLFNMLYATVGDYFLAMDPYDFYDTVDHDSGEIMDVLLHNFVYPLQLLILMHFYAKFKPNIFLYILLGAGILFTLEWISVTFFHLYLFKKWKFIYSLIFYIFVLTFNVFFYNKFHSYIQNQIQINVEGEANGNRFTN
jgi:hypothetical protein